jgi:hypothetical protein
VFATIKGAKLKSMLPPSLINMDVEDLKALCLDHLVSTVRRSCRLFLYAILLACSIAVPADMMRAMIFTSSLVLSRLSAPPRVK